MQFNPQNAVLIWSKPMHDGMFELCAKKHAGEYAEIVVLTQFFSGILTQQAIEEALAKLKTERPAEYDEYILYLSETELACYRAGRGRYLQIS